MSLRVKLQVCNSSRPVRVPLPVAEEEATDWTAVSLGIIALLALLGLIPLWLIVYLAWTG